jgi:hypothetical protein
MVRCDRPGRSCRSSLPTIDIAGLDSARRRVHQAGASFFFFFSDVKHLWRSDPPMKDGNEGGRG